MDALFGEFERRAHGAAASIVDPATGRHADVFVNRVGDTGVVIRTRGSPAFAREPERRLGMEQGSIELMDETASPARPSVYLAHASEDHAALARPLAEKLLANGIDVWLDTWEIRSGDSLKRRMEEGLGNCTHFMVLLTPNSIGKPWVETEIDAGFLKSVEGAARFIGLRVGIRIDQLSVFLRTLRCPSFDPAKDSDVGDLVGDLHGVSRKPPLGKAPRYVQRFPDDTGGWSSAALVVAEFLVKSSKTARKFDPQTSIENIVAGTGLAEEDARLAVLDLEDGGLIERSKTISSRTLWPLPALFNEFDRRFMGFDNEKDAVVVATWLLNQGLRQIRSAAIREAFPELSQRRLNSALNYLEGAKAVQVQHFMKGDDLLRVDDRTRRFIKNRA